MNNRSGSAGSFGKTGIGLVSALAAVAAVVLAIGGGRANANNFGDFAGFTVSVPSPQAAGTQFTVTVTAYDSDHDGDANYSGTKCIKFSGPATSPSGNAPAYPAGSGTCAGSLVTFSNSSFKATVPITLYAAQSAATLKVTDVATGKSGTSGGFVVNPAPLDHFKLAAGTPEVAGTQFTATVSAFDLYGNAPSAWVSTNGCVAFSGPGTIGSFAPIYPAATAPCVSGQSQLAFNASGQAPAQMTLFKAEAPTLVVTGGGKTGSTSFTVNPAPLDHFTLSGLAPEVAGTQFTATVSAFDLYGNAPSAWVSTNGCVAFSGPGTIGSFAPIYPAATAPCVSGQSQLAFNASGQAPAQMTLFKADTPPGQTTLTVTGGGKTGSTSFSVNPGTLLPSFVAQPTNAQISTPIYSNVVTQAPVTVGVADTYGNQAPDGTAVTMTAAVPVSAARCSSRRASGVASFGDLTLAAIGQYTADRRCRLQRCDHGQQPVPDRPAARGLLRRRRAR